MAGGTLAFEKMSPLKIELHLQALLLGIVIVIVVGNGDAGLIPGAEQDEAHQNESKDGFHIPVLMRTSMSGFANDCYADLVVE